MQVHVLENEAQKPLADPLVSRRYARLLLGCENNAQLTRLRQHPAFPRSVQIDTIEAWPASELERFIEVLKEERP